MVTVLSVWLVFRSISLHQILNALRAANYWWLIPNLAFGFLALLFQAVRWRVLISPLRRLPIRDVFAATSIGLLINNILPLRLGEYARAHVLARRDSELSASPLLASVLVERVIFDIGLLAIILLIVSFFIPLYRDFEFGTSAIVGVALLIILLTLVIMAVVLPRTMLRVVSGILRVLPVGYRPSVRESMQQFFDMMLLMRKRDVVQMGFVITAVIWLCMALSIYSLFQSFSFHLPFTASFVLLAALVLAMIIPSLPGYIGIFHLAAVLTLSAYDIGDAGARAYSIVLHLSQYVPTTILGLIFLHRINLSLGQIKSSVADVKGED